MGSKKYKRAGFATALHRRCTSVHGGGHGLLLLLALFTISFLGGCFGDVQQGPADEADATGEATVDPPTLNAVPSPTNDPTPTFLWTHEQAEELSFDLDISPSSDYASAISEEGLSESSYTVVIPLDDGGWSWRVRARDENGNESDWATSSFLLDTVAPIVVSSSPEFDAESISTTTSFQLVFSETINLDVSLELGFSPEIQSDIGNPVWSSTSEPDDTVSFTPTDPLERGTDYLISLSLAEDPAGNAMDEFALSFSTIPFTIVSSTTPAGDSLEVPVDTDISVVYSMSMDTGSSPTLDFDPAIAGTVPAPAWSTTLVTGDTATFILSDPLEGGPTTYSVTLSGGLDIDGATGPTHLFSFTTADTTPPSLLSSTPAEGATGVTVYTAEIRLVFDETMDRSAAPALSFNPAYTGTISTPTWSATNETDDTATFSLSDPLTESTTYTVTISGGRDLATDPNPMVDDSFGFTTAVAPALASIDISPTSPMVAVGQSKQFMATGNYDDGSNWPLPTITNPITWTSSNTAVATIDAITGMANILVAGTTTITATYGLITGSTSLTGVNLPSPPSTVSASASGMTITVSWSSVPVATSYKIYRATNSNGTYTLITTAASTSYIDSGLGVCETYYYKVSAVNEVGEGTLSTAYGSDTTQPSIPTGIGASASGDTITVTWNAVSCASSYKVHRAASATGTYSVIGTPTATSYADSGLSAGTYYYKVSAINGTGESAKSSYDSASIVYYTLSVSKSGSGSGTVTSSPSGISCGGDCSQSYLADTVVTLSRSAASGSQFSGWSGACSGTGGCTVTMNTGKSVDADFAIVPPSVSNPNPSNGAMVAGGSSGQLLRVTHVGATSGTIYYDDDSTISYSVPATVNGNYLEATIPYVAGEMKDNGTNYWYVEASNAGGTTRYPSSGNLSFTVQNDSCSNNATLLGVNASAQTYAINPSGDEDYFNFSATAGRTYNIETTGGTDTYLHLYSTNWSTEIDSDDDSGSGTNALIVWTAPSSGTYCFKVRGYSSSTTGSYSISVISFTGIDGVILKSTTPETYGSMTFSYSGAEYDSYYLNHWIINQVGGYMQFSFSGRKNFNFYAQGSTAGGTSYSYIDIYVNGSLLRSNYFVSSGWGTYWIDSAEFGTGSNTVKIVLKIGSGESFATNLWLDEAWTD